MADPYHTTEADRVFARFGVTGQAAAILMILFGILIIVFPALVAILVGIYLIVVGLLQLLGSMENRPRAVAPPPPPAGPPAYRPPSYP
jgi:uncharacterized membrane protein HdeD (DUF308 family)